MYEPGTVLMGKYRVGRVIGRGGMGVVMACEHVELRTGVALKFLAEKYVDREDIVERFVREARACAQLRSENICKVSDVGRLDNGVPYFVMELLEGRDLAKTLRVGGPLDVTSAADYILQACDAIAEAHAAHIIHRDLKPGNLFLTQRRDGGALIKVLDFGVAKARVDEQNHTLTGADVVVGSPSYMAPEQIRSSHHADPRSDIWSLGVILHEMLSGKPPFKGETIADLAVRITLDPLPPLIGVPPAFAAIVAKCLEKSPAARYQNVADLALALEPFAPLVTAPSRSSALRARSFAAPPGAPTLMQPPAAPVLPPEMIAAMGRPTTPIRAPLLSQQMTQVHAAQLEQLQPASTTIRGASGVMAGPPVEVPPSNGRRWLTIGIVAAMVIGVGAGVFAGTSGGGRAHTAATPVAPPAPAAAAVVPVPVPVPVPAPVVTPPDAAVEAASPPSPPDAALVPATDPVVVAAPRAVPPKHKPTPVVVTPPVVKEKPKTREQIGESRI